MNRRDYFFRQLVTEDELDAGFECAEQADRAIVADLGLVGVVSGLTVSQHSPSANMTVDVAAGVAYEQQGQRCAIASTQSPDLSVDSLSVSTSVVTPGNEKYVGLFVKFARALSDPRLDGNNLTVYFVRAESFTLWKVQGAEAVIPTAVPPALLSDAILLADARLIFGQTQIVNADLSTSRRQAAFKFSTISVGTPEESDAAVLAAATGDLSAHLADTTDAHDASAVSYAGSGNWADGSTIAAVNLEAVVDEIVQNLARTNTGNSGAGRIGAQTQAASFTGAPFSLSPGQIQAQIASLLGFINGLFRARTLTAAAAVDDAGYRDGTIFLDPSANFNVSLPDPTAHKGRRIWFVDISGFMSSPTRSTTIARYSGTNINGSAADYTLGADFGQWCAVSDGVGWYIA
jgi:hypothetical protein